MRTRSLARAVEYPQGLKVVRDYDNSITRVAANARSYPGALNRAERCKGADESMLQATTSSRCPGRATSNVGAALSVAWNDV